MISAGRGKYTNNKQDGFDMTDAKQVYPHTPAAFINAIREEGTKAQACDYLQEQWNETCALRAEIKFLSAALQQSQAETAAAYERAARETLQFVLANVVDLASRLLEMGDERGVNSLCVLVKALEEVQETHIIPAIVGVFSTPDQTAALDAVVAKAEAAGMREAAAIVREHGSETDSPNAAFELGVAAQAILAAIPKGGAE